MYSVWLVFISLCCRLSSRVWVHRREAVLLCFAPLQLHRPHHPQSPLSDVENRAGVDFLLQVSGLTVVTSTFLFTANLHGQGVEADVPPIYLLLPLPSSQGNVTKISFTSCLISRLLMWPVCIVFYWILCVMDRVTL